MRATLKALGWSGDRTLANGAKNKCDRPTIQIKKYLQLLFEALHTKASATPICHT